MLAGALLSFFGGAAQHLSNKQMTREGRRQAQAQFDQQMDHSVRRRVEDAERAGVHPLFALGASVGASPTLSAGGESGGNSLANGLAEAGRILGTTEATKAQARRDEAQASYFDALAANARNQRVNQTGQDKPALTVFGDPIRQEEPALAKPVYEQPILPTTKPGDRSTETGVRSPYVEFRRRDGSKGTAFGAEVPGAEELNAFWIPIQNWWHTSKQARERIRRALGITTSPTAYLQANPEAAAQLARSPRARKLRRELSRFNKAISGRPIR